MTPDLRHALYFVHPKRLGADLYELQEAVEKELREAR